MGTYRNEDIRDGGLLRGAVGFAAAALLGAGLLYPLAGVGIARLLFPHEAGGSLIEREGRILGSTLVAQPFRDDRYFHPRPSAAAFDPMAAAGSNLARTDPALREAIATEPATVARREGVDLAAVPPDLVTRSGAGLDPHISPQAAAIQIERVARARGLAPAVVRTLVERQTEGPQLGLLGAARVNVLELNLALDATGAPGR